MLDLIQRSHLNMNLSKTDHWICFVFLSKIKKNLGRVQHVKDLGVFLDSQFWKEII